MLLIRRERLRRRLSLQEVSYLVKVDVPTLSRVERGMLVPYRGVRAKLEAFYGLPADQLLSQVPDEGSPGHD